MVVKQNFFAEQSRVEHPTCNKLQMVLVIVYVIVTQLLF